jgi:hypothetical protein
MQSLVAADSLLDTFLSSEKNPQRLSRVLKEINDMRENLELAYFYIPIKEIDALRKKNADRSAEWVLRILKDQPAGFTDMRNINVAMEHAINYHLFTAQPIKRANRDSITFRTSERSGWVDRNYRQELVE